MSDLRLFAVKRQPTIERAAGRARRLWPASRGFQAAYLKGWRARRNGRGPGSCPYNRKLDGWGGVWRAVWFQGWYEGEIIPA